MKLERHSLITASSTSCHTRPPPSFRPHAHEYHSYVPPKQQKARRRLLRRVWRRSKDIVFGALDEGMVTLLVLCCGLRRELEADDPDRPLSRRKKTNSNAPEKARF